MALLVTANKRYGNGSRAYKMQDVFIEENAQRVETNQKCYYPEITSIAWLFSRIQIVCILVT